MSKKKTLIILGVMVIVVGVIVAAFFLTAHK